MFGHTERDSETAIEAGLTSSSAEPCFRIHFETHFVDNHLYV